MEGRTIKNLQFGCIDANNELQAVGEKFFIDAFLPYEQYQIDKFFSGSKYYICGDKGTGKTALLKYLECILAQDPQNKVISIRFKSDIDEEDRKGMRAKISNIDETTIDQKPEELQSYRLAWYLYILKTIFEAEKTGEYLFFDESPEKNIIKKLLELIYEGQSGKIIPHLKKGRFSLTASSTGLSAEVEAEIEFDEDTKQINFVKTIKKILALFEALIPGRNNVYLVFDELELSVRNKKELKRDVELIRDLILVIDELNKKSSKNNLGIKLIGSIRNDVLTHVSSAGYEINKCVEDFGVFISWYQRGGDERTQPLLRMIERKINASEKMLGIPISENVWDTYFQGEINKESVTRYILGLTWYRPRDIIRLLNMAQTMADEKSTIINQEMFERAMLEYAKKSWEEICEELALMYEKEEDISAIHRIYYGINLPFTRSEIESRMSRLSSDYTDVENFTKRIRTVDFLEKSYKCGIIGNSSQRMMFKFLGYDQIDVSMNMVLHKPLRNFFAVKYE